MNVETTLSSTRRNLVLMGALFCLALALRLYHIESQSLWADEGNSISLAQRSLIRIAQDSARDIHPPLYTWLLHVWMAVAGRSVLAVRGLSALLGAGVVLLTFLIARRLFDLRAALVAAAAAAVSPFAIHYSQETRMYMLVTLLAATSWLLLLRWLEQPTRRLLAAWWLVALALIYTHYVAAAIVVAQNLVWLALKRKEEREKRKESQALFSFLFPLPSSWSWVAAQLALVATYLPWIWYARRTLFGWPATVQPLAPGAIVADLLRVASLGLGPREGWTWLPGLLAGLLLAGLLLPARRSRAQAPRLVAGAWLLVPVGLVLLLSLDRPFYHAKFLLMVLPAFHILLGRGAAALTSRIPFPQLASGAAAVGLAAATLGPLSQEWTNPALWRDDYRGIVQTIQQASGPSDAVFLLDAGQVEVFDYYYQGALPRYRALPSLRYETSETQRQLEEIAGRHRRLYVILWGERVADPAGFVERWLGERAYKGGDRWYGTVRVQTYEFGAPDPKMSRVRRRFGPTIWLERASAPAQARAGDMLRVTLRWHADGPVERLPLMFVHLVDAQNQIVAQYDGLPAPLPPTEWPAGAGQLGRAGLLVPATTPPGRYRITLGLYDAATGERLPLPDGTDVITLSTLTLEPPAQ